MLDEIDLREDHLLYFGIENRKSLWKVNIANCVNF